MPVLSPKVRGPISECSRFVAVDHVITSTDVTIVDVTIVVFRGADYVAVCQVSPAVAIYANVPLNPGEHLAEGERVNAQQTLRVRVGTRRTTWSCRGA